MSNNEHHFDTNDSGESKKFPQQLEPGVARLLRLRHPNLGSTVTQSVKGNKLEDIVPSSHNCDVPHVNCTDYQLIDISEDGFVSPVIDNGNTKDDLKLPTDDSLPSQIKVGFAEEKDLVMSVMSSMEEQQICALKDIGPKYIWGGTD